MPLALAGFAFHSLGEQRDNIPCWKGREASASATRWLPLAGSGAQVLEAAGVLGAEQCAFRHATR
jgi:hypothetical protein